MPDTVDQATRSRIMARVSGRDTKPEFALRRALHVRGLRYRLHVRSLPGTPDLVFPRFRAACFVNGCFWHRHPGCPRTTDPSTRREFWQTKFRANVERDRRTRQELLEGGWRVAIVWECALRAELAHITARTFDHWIRGQEREFETGLVPALTAYDPVAVVVQVGRRRQGMRKAKRPCCPLNPSVAVPSGRYARRPLVFVCHPLGVALFTPCAGACLYCAQPPIARQDRWQ